MFKYQATGNHADCILLESTGSFTHLKRSGKLLWCEQRSVTCLWVALTSDKEMYLD